VVIWIVPKLSALSAQEMSSFNRNVFFLLAVICYSLFRDVCSQLWTQLSFSKIFVSDYFFWFRDRCEEQRFLVCRNLSLFVSFFWERIRRFVLQSFTKRKLATVWWWLSNGSGEILLPSYWRSSRIGIGFDLYLLEESWYKGNVWLRSKSE